METTSLYARLGGYDAIAAVTDELLARLLNDPQLGGFWKGHSENSLRRDRQLVVNYMCAAAGGPVFYTGRDLKTSHKGLGVSVSDWEVFMQHACAVLEQCAVPVPERDEVLAFLTGLLGDVVELIFQHTGGAYREGAHMVKQEIQAAIAPLPHAGAHPHGREEQVRWHSSGGTAHTRSVRQQTGSTTRGSLSKGGLIMGHRAKRHIVLVLVSCLLAGLVLTASAQMATSPIEPRAGTWKTWVLASGKELRLAPPPDAQATATELQELRVLAGQRDAAALERIRYWDFWSPAHRWNELLIDTRVTQNRFGPDGLRAFAMLNVAIHDALIAAWDSKYAHNRRRPGEADPQLATALPVPRSPSYPCEHSVAAGAGSAVLAHLFPKEAQRFTEAAEEASRSRVLAGVVYPSDARAGLELGRAVAARVIEYLKLDGTKWSGAVPVGPGLWQGKDPGGVDEVRWKPFVLASASQFRPGPPPAPDSPERAAEVAEVKNFKRTPVTNAKASYWAYGQYGGAGLLFRLSEEIGRELAEDGLDGNAPRAARAYALVHVAHYEAYIASQDAKFHYWTARPNQFDPSITTVVPNPNHPSYPSNAAAVGMAPALVLGHLCPRQAARYLGWAQEFGESRLWAGIHFRSDIEAGWEIGRRVAAAFIERAKHDGAE